MHSVLYCYRCPTRHPQNALLLTLLLLAAALAGASLYQPPPVTMRWGLPALFALCAGGSMVLLLGWVRQTQHSLEVTERHVRWQTGLIFRRRVTLCLHEVTTVYADLHPWDSGRCDHLAFALRTSEVVRVPSACLRTSARPIVNLLREAHPHLSLEVREKA